MDKGDLIILTGAAIIIGGAFYLLRRQGRFYFKKMEKDIKDNNESKIEELHPRIRSNARHFIQLAKKDGVILKITEAKRSLEDQLKYYNAGTSKVTFGYHNVGLALDVYPVINGVINCSYYSDDATLNKIIKAGKKAGFDSLYDIAKWDKPHYQKTFDLSLSEAKERFYSQSVRKDNYIKLNK